MVSEHLIEKLQRILKEKYNKDLSYSEVAKLGNDLVDIFDTLVNIKKKEIYDKQD